MVKDPFVGLVAIGRRAKDIACIGGTRRETKSGRGWTAYSPRVPSPHNLSTNELHDVTENQMLLQNFWNEYKN
jgi:hypothetical protein